MFQHSIQTSEFQDTVSCQDVKTADFARPSAKEAGKPVGRADCEAAGAITPDTFAFYALESDQWQGKRALVIDRDAVTVTMPPASNTGATVTLEADWYNKQKTRCLIDWLTFTLPVTNYDDMLGCVAQWTDYFGGGSPCRAKNGYSDGRLCNDGTYIFWHPERLEMKVCVTLSGTALQTHALRCGSDAWVYLMVKALDEGAKFSRVDIALDTITVDFATVQDACKSDALVTRAKNVDGTESYRGNGGGIVRIGNRESRRYVRIYDKGAQLGLDVTWVRFEVELKGEYAQAAAVMLIAKALDPESLVASAVDFRDVTADSNVTRRERVAWWAELMDGFKRVSMTTAEKVMESYDRTLAWLKRQVAPAMAFMAAMDSGGVDWFYELLTLGRGRISPEKRLLISAVSAAVGGVAYTPVKAPDNEQLEFQFVRLLNLAAAKVA